MVKFKGVDELRAHLVRLDERYGPYAECLWRQGIWSTDIIVNSPPDVLASILADSGPPGNAHLVHASDLIARSRPAGTLWNCCGSGSITGTSMINAYLPTWAEGVSQLIGIL